MRSAKNRHDVAIGNRVARENQRRNLVENLRKATVPVIEDLRNVAKRRLWHCFPSHRGEALRIVRGIERICALLAAAQVRLDSLLIRLEEREL
jgi:hypothetical protein